MEALKDTTEWDVEEILDCRADAGGLRFLVRWFGFRTTTWEPLGNLLNSAQLVDDYMKTNNCPRVLDTERTGTGDHDTLYRHTIFAHWGAYFSDVSDFRSGNTERGESQLARMAKMMVGGNRHEDDSMLDAFEKVYVNADSVNAGSRRREKTATNKISSAFSSQDFRKYTLTVTALPYGITPDDFYAFIANLRHHEGPGAYRAVEGSYFFSTQDACREARRDPWQDRLWEP